MSRAATIVVPRRLPGVTSGRAVYRRRRIAAGLVACALVVGTNSLAGNVLADRGDDLASVSAVRQNPRTYIVQPGDTMWSIARRFGPAGRTALYVEALISLNGGTGLAVAQAVRLP